MATFEFESRLSAMTEGHASASGLVRVTVASGTRRVDLVLPGAIPVAELVPELARSVGLLNAVTVHAGYHLVTQEGRELTSDAGLISQGIEDGGLLTVTAGVDDQHPRMYDDVVEAMTDAVERDFERWGPTSGRRTALVAAELLMLLGAATLILQEATAAALAAAAVSLALVAGAIVLSRTRHEAETAVSVAWIGAGYAAVAGLMLAPGGMTFGLPTACAGGGALLAGLVTLVGLGECRALVVPPVVVGAIFLATGFVMWGGAIDPAVVLTITLTLVVMLGSILPWVALSVTGTTVDRLDAHLDITADAHEIDPARVAADARVAHQILVAGSGCVGLLLVLVAPLAVSLGVTGALLALTCSGVVMLRTRQHRTGSEVLVGVGSGILGLVSMVVAMVWLQPSWRSATVIALIASGAALLALAVLPSGPSARRGRVGDIAESVALISLLPLLVLATGVLSAIRG